jgi:hypothetical protein
MSSSNCPPQLHLTLPPNATSFKRSFEQFGFDLDSPVGADAGSSSGSSSSGSDRNDRSKRARSASHSSRGDTDESSSSRNSSSSFRSDSEDSALSSSRSLASNPSATHLHAMTSYLQPPRLPTPDLPDVEMADYPLEGPPRPVTPPTPPPVITTRDDLFRLSLDRLGGFDSEALSLRESRIHAIRSPTPPPTLPPLVLTSTLVDGHLNPTPAFPTSRSESSALADSLYHIDLPISSRLQAAGRHSPSFHTFAGLSTAPRTSSHELRGTEGSGRRGEPPPYLPRSVTLIMTPNTITPRHQHLRCLSPHRRLGATPRTGRVPVIGHSDPVILTTYRHPGRKLSPRTARHSAIDWIRLSTF